MSLLDALLLDPYRINVWIAYRTDGIAGTGTQSDPYDGSTNFAAAVPVTNLSYNGQEATATSAGHPYNNNDVVTIDGVTGAGAAQWNGTFLIYGVTSNTFKYYMNATPAAVAGGLPINALKVLGYRFDNVMSTLGANTNVHLGPTSGNRPFLTKGYAVGATGGWQVKAGMKIIGSGIDVTVLRLVAQAASANFFAMGHDLATGGQPTQTDYFEVSDLTIDCNLMIPLSNSGTCGAVRVMGNHASVRRVKVINWGTNDATKPCVVICVITADRTAGITQITQVVDCGIEECLALSPASSPTNAPVTVLHAGAKEDSGSDAEGYGTGHLIRDCFVDCGSPTASAEYRGLSMAWCKGGIVEGNQVHNTKYGGPCISKSSARDLVVRNNFYKNVAKGPFWNLATLSATSLFNLARDSDQTIAIGTTSSAHGMLAGDRIKISATVGSGTNYYQGTFVIKDVPLSTTFRYQMQGAPLVDASTATMQKIFGVAKLVVEANTIELATGSTGLIGIHLNDASLSPQTPDYAHGDVVIRDNKIRYLDGAFDTGYSGYGIQVNGAKNLLVRNNVVEAVPANPIRNIRCGSVEYFNNRTPAGILIQGVNEDNNNKKYDELETDAEDALVLAVLNRR